MEKLVDHCFPHFYYFHSHYLCNWLNGTNEWMNEWMFELSPFSWSSNVIVIFVIISIIRLKGVSHQHRNRLLVLLIKTQKSSSWKLLTIERTIVLFVDAACHCCLFAIVNNNFFFLSLKQIEPKSNYRHET